MNDSDSNFEYLELTSSRVESSTRTSLVFSLSSTLMSLERNLEYLRVSITLHYMSHEIPNVMEPRNFFFIRPIKLNNIDMNMRNCFRMIARYFRVRKLIKFVQCAKCDWTCT